MRGDQNLGNKVRLSVRYNWYDTFNGVIGAIPVQGVTQPRVNKNTLVSYTHALKPNLYNDFRIGYHRIDFDTLNHFAVNGIASAGAELGIPGFDGDVRFGNPGLPSIVISNFSGLGEGGTNWYQFDTTFQVSNVLAYTRGAHNVRAGFDLRRLATGRRAANDTRGRFEFTGDDHRHDDRRRRLLGGRLHAGIAAHRHHACRSDPGACRQLAQRVLHQRRVAGVTRPHAQPGAALRDEHAGADLHRAGHHARRELLDHHPAQPVGVPGQRVRVHRAEQQGFRAASGSDLSPR